MNGGFGMLLDGSEESGEKARSMLDWDVSNGVNRRAWDGHPLAKDAIRKTQERIPGYNLTVCNETDPELLKNL